MTETAPPVAWLKGEPPPPGVYWRPELDLWWPVADRKWRTAPAHVMKRVPDSDQTVAACASARRRTCVQAGGHVGLWPMHLAKKFQRVFTFEIAPGNFEACTRNCAQFKNVTVMNFGLGAEHNVSVPLAGKGSAATWRVDPDGKLSASLTTIDHLGLSDCDAIILDVEGYELEALLGASSTIERNRPVIHVEQLAKHGDGVHRHLRSLNYHVHAHVRKDVIYVPGPK